MKYIITEEQYDRVLNHRSVFWVKRRYNLVKESLRDTMKLMRSSVCRINDYETFEKEFFHTMMDDLHPHFYEDEDLVYNDLFFVLRDLFYVECTEFYFSVREMC
jgi:hypothetical protein